MKKSKKLKIAGLIALLAGGMFFLINKYCNESNNDSDGQTTGVMKETVAQKPLTIQQLERYIQDCDEYMAKLDSVIKSKDTDPETRFEARQAYKYTAEKRAKIQKELMEMQGKQVDFHDAAKTR